MQQIAHSVTFKVSQMVLREVFYAAIKTLQEGSVKKRIKFKDLVKILHDLKSQHCTAAYLSLLRLENSFQL